MSGATTKDVLAQADLPVMLRTHIVPDHVGDPEFARGQRPFSNATGFTSSRSTIQLCRAVPSACVLRRPFHDSALIAQLATAMMEVWQQLGLPLGVPLRRPHPQATLVTAGSEDTRALVDELRAYASPNRET